MQKRLILLLTLSLILAVTCSRILDTDDKELNLTGFIFNKVTNEPVQDAEVVIYSQDNKTTQSDENGAFEFNFDLEDDAVLLFEVKKDSFSTTSFEKSVKSGEAVELDTVFLDPQVLATKVKGKLINNFNNEPINSGIINVDILDYPVYTNSQGEFSFIFNTNQSLAITLISEKNYFVSDTLTIDVTPGYEFDLESINLNYVYAPGAVTGSVLDARADTAVSAVKVSMVGEPNVITKTNADGQFTLDTQINEAKAISIQFSKYPFSSKTITIDQIAPEEEINVGTVKLDPPAYDTMTLFGKVKDSESKNISGVSIYLEEFPEISASTDDNGYFSVDLQVEEEMPLTLSLEHDNYQNLQIDTTASPETDLNLGTITLTSKYANTTIQGTILDETTNKPIANAKILENNLGQYTMSDENGEFDLSLNLTNTQNLNIAISKYPYETKTIQLDNVTPGENVDLETVLLTPPDITPSEVFGVVINETGDPIPGIEITVSEIPDINVTSGNNGQFRFNLTVIEQDSSVTVNFKGNDNYIGKDTTITVLQETDKNLDKIQLFYKNDDVQIIGTILDETTNKPIANAKILENNLGQYTMSDENGEFDLSLNLTNTQNLNIAISKYPYETKTIQLDNVTPGENVDLETISLTPPPIEPITLNGVIMDKKSNNPIPDVSVTLAEYPLISDKSNEQGQFSLTISEPKSLVDTLNISFSPSSDAYDDTTMTDFIVNSGDEKNIMIYMENNFSPIEITGQVLDQNSDAVIEADVTIEEYPEMYATTDAAGNFTFSDSLSLTSEKQIHFNIAKNGYYTATVSNYVTPDMGTLNIDVEMLKKVPKSLLFVSADPKSIKINEAGGVTTSELTFQVLDSRGNPLDISAIAPIEVRIVNSGIGATLSDEIIYTDTDGFASTYVNSGTIAGVVEIEAVINFEGDQITVGPVPLNIHAGKPDYFNRLGTNYINVPIPYYGKITDEYIGVTAQLADQYNNIIKEETAIYFTLEKPYGAIMGSSEDGSTNEDGVTTVKYWCPNSFDPTVLTGGEEFLTISAETQNAGKVDSSTTVLLTGPTEPITASPSTFTIDDDNGDSFTITVEDPNGHPLSEGTKITVVPDKPDVFTASINCPDDGLPDVVSGYTTFTVTCSPKEIDEGDVPYYGGISVEIKVTSKNNDRSLIVTGTKE